MKNVSILAVIWTAMVAGVLWLAGPVRLNYDDYVNSSYFVLCHSMDKHGSATLLPSGLLMSAFHVVDEDSDGVLTQQERDCALETQTGEIFSGTVVWPVKDIETIDIVIIKPEENLGVGNSVDLTSPPVGTPLFLIGYPGGVNSPHLYWGYQSVDSRKKTSRASVNMEFGVSGGGMFNQVNGKLVGVAVNLRSNLFHDGMTLPQWSEYVRIQDIRKELAGDGVEWYLDTAPVPKEYTMRECLAWMFFASIVGGWFTFWMAKAIKAYRG